VRNKYGRPFGVKYRTRHGEKIMYFYDGGFKKDKNGISRIEVDKVPKVYRNNNPTSLMARLRRQTL
jgi:hypothetical protein